MSRGDALSVLRQALEEHGCQPRSTAARCPAHDDRQASLSFGQGDDGAVLKCHAGCDTSGVLEELGLSAADLFDQARDQGRSQVIAEYKYTDEHGHLLFVKERYLPKRFLLKRPDGLGGWTYGLGDTRRVLYNLPAVIAAAAIGQVVYVAEGEKDADAIIRAGAVATCNFDGAAKEGQRPKWRPEYGDTLKGASVIVVADNDPAGRAHAAAIAADLDGKALSVAILAAAAGNDASDHLAAGLSLAELVPGAEAPPGQEISRVGQLRAALLDSDALDNLPEPKALIDGVVSCDSLIWLHGKPGCGKSFVALDWAGCISTGLPWQGRVVEQGPVLYVIAEGVSGLRQRVRAWENYTGTKTGVTFLPVAVQLMNPADVAAVIEVAGGINPILIVIDTQARVTVGADENSSKDMGEFVAAVGKIRGATRSAVLIVHHEARAGENMRGSTALEGAADTQVRVTKDEANLQLDNPKQKDAPEFEPVKLRLVPRLDSATVQSRDWAHEEEDLSASEQKIVAILRDTFGPNGSPGGQLLEVSGLPKSTYYRAINRLLQAGTVDNVGTKMRTHLLLPEFAEVQSDGRAKVPQGRGTNTRKASGTHKLVPASPTTENGSPPAKVPPVPSSPTDRETPSPSPTPL